jgi:hypothetical protein
LLASPKGFKDVAISLLRDRLVLGEARMLVVERNGGIDRAGQCARLTNLNLARGRNLAGSAFSPVLW